MAVRAFSLWAEKVGGALQWRVVAETGGDRQYLHYRTWHGYEGDGPPDEVVRFLDTVVAKFRATPFDPSARSEWWKPVGPKQYNLAFWPRQHV